MANSNLLNTITQPEFTAMLRARMGMAYPLVYKNISSSKERPTTADEPNWPNRFALFVLFVLIPALLVFLLKYLMIFDF